MLTKKLQALKAKTGFTLVELIVVIAIIAILAAILIPLLVNHVGNARCSQEIADAKSSFNVASDYIVSLIADDGTIPTEDELEEFVQDSGGHGSAGVTLSFNTITLDISATVGNHTYPGGGGGCTRSNCGG